MDARQGKQPTTDDIPLSKELCAKAGGWEKAGRRGTPTEYVFNGRARVLKFGRPAPFESFEEFQEFLRQLQLSMDAHNAFVGPGSGPTGYLITNAYWQAHIKDVVKLRDGTVQYVTKGVFCLPEGPAPYGFDKVIEVSVPDLHSRLWVCEHPWVGWSLDKAPGPPRVLPGPQRFPHIKPPPVPPKPGEPSHHPIHKPAEPGSMTMDALLKSLRDEGLQFPPDLVSTYLLALQTKRFVLLTGISGTGKTQLALGVAKFYRRADTTPASDLADATIAPARNDVPQDTVRLAALPYHRTRHCAVIPVALTRHMHFAPALDDGPRKMQVWYPDGASILTCWRSTKVGRDVTTVTFNGPFRRWFEEHLQEGDHFYLSVVPGEDDAPDGLRFSLELPSLSGDTDQAPLSPSERSVATRPCVTYELISVRPDWTDHRGLLGFYNPLTEQYQPTPFLQLLMDAEYEARQADGEGRIALPFFAILDEMNLARVEHYFADFLSALESGEPLHLHDSTAVEEGESSDEVIAVPRRLRIPDNLFFTGTVNVDETTYMFSPKVLDRAFTNCTDGGCYHLIFIAGNQEAIGRKRARIRQCRDARRAASTIPGVVACLVGRHLLPVCHAF